MADKWCHCLSLSFSIAETKRVMKKLTTHVTVTFDVLINKPKNILLFPFKMKYFCMVLDCNTPSLLDIMQFAS